MTALSRVFIVSGFFGFAAHQDGPRARSNLAVLASISLHVVTQQYISWSHQATIHGVSPSPDNTATERRSTSRRQYARRTDWSQRDDCCFEGTKACSRLGDGESVNFVPPAAQWAIDNTLFDNTFTNGVDGRTN